jgi:hypothetical protein
MLVSHRLGDPGLTAATTCRTPDPRMWFTLPAAGLAVGLSAMPLAYQSASGFRMLLPQGFAPSAEFSQQGTAAAAPAPPGARVVLDSVFTDGTGPTASSLALAVVDAPLVLDNGTPERVAALAIAYLRDQLSSELRIEWVERVPAGRGEAMELAGRVELDDQERVAQFAFVPFGDRQIVLTASLPSSRFATLGPAIEKSLASLAFDRPVSQPPSRRAALGAAIGGLVGLVVVAVRFFAHRVRVS